MKAIEVRSTKLRTSPAQVTPQLVELSLGHSCNHEEGGHGYGPLSGAANCVGKVGTPSRATLARIFTRAGGIVPEPMKKPRRLSMVRLSYPNDCWPAS